MIVRTDLSIPQQLVQAAHAAAEVGRRLIPADIDHPHLVVLAVPGEPDLKSISDRLQLSMPVVEWREPDRDNEVTAIALFPDVTLRGGTGRMLRALPLWNGGPRVHADHAV